MKPTQIEQEPPRRFISTAIPYVNGKPHLGHALEFIQTDALARAHRWRGEEVWFLTGSDENSLKNVQAAEREGLSPSTLVERNAALYRALDVELDLSYNDFIRTSTDPRHLIGVRKLWEACARNGDIYQRPYRGLYCVGCEAFYSEAESTEMGGRCPEHDTPLEVIEEENYFFRLSRYTAQLEALIATDTLRIVPESRKNEVLRFIQGGLEDFSISRSQARARGWGIPVPDDPQQVIYVWFDALGNYITALDYGDEGQRYQRFWRAAPQRVHVIGKGVIRFHAVYWPAMLLSAGVPLPTTIFVHGYITVQSAKMSKSLGNVVDPVAVARHYGIDALRYYLLREIHATGDGDFDLERFERVYTADLADQLGNLLNRVVSMIGRYYGGYIPAPSTPDPQDQALIDTATGLHARLDEAITHYATHKAMDALWEVVAAANKYIVVVEPWVLAKQRNANDAATADAAEQRLATTLYTLAELLRLVAYGLTPFLPTTAAAIKAQLGLPSDTTQTWATALRWGQTPPGTHVQPGALLFPKLEKSRPVPLPERAQAPTKVHTPLP